MTTKAETKDGVREYAKIVESYRDEDGKVKKRVIQNLGPIKSEEDRERFEQIVEEYEEGESFVRLNDVKLEGCREFGVTYAVEGLLDEYGIGGLVRERVTDNGAEFDVWKVLKAMIVKQVLEPSSERETFEWIEEDYTRDLDVDQHHLYRALDHLVGGKEGLERDLFERLKEESLLEDMTTFYDLTSSYVEGTACEIALHGYSRDHRSDQPQVVLALVMMDGLPVMHEVLPGNTLDKTTLEQLVKSLENRLQAEGTVFVADKGLMTEDNMEVCEKAKYPYILGVPRRKNEKAEELLREEVPGTDSQRACEIHREEVGDAMRRYILCMDEKTREERLETLKEIREEKKEELQELKNRYEKSRSGEGRGRPMTEKGAMKRVKKILGKSKRLFDVDVGETIEWKLDEEAWDYERAIAGKFLLVTTTDLPPNRAMEKYKELGTVERAFDKIKNSLDIRPIYHYKPGRVKAHIFLCILGLLVHKIIEKLTGETVETVLKRLKRIHLTELETPEISRKKLTQLNSKQKRIFEKLEIEAPKELKVQEDLW
ncbi:MAG: IS1634 family transposase [Candidatus Hadarchaeia archaeon]